MPAEKIYRRDFAIFRANKNNNGYAAEFRLSDVEKDGKMVKLMFLTMAPQADSERSFLWKEKGITVKLSETDIGEFLAVLSGRQESINQGKGLYHASPKGGTKSVVFNYGENKAFYLKVSGFDGDKKSLGNYYVNLTNADAEVLRVLLEHALVQMFEW